MTELWLLFREAPPSEQIWTWAILTITGLVLGFSAAYYWPEIRQVGRDIRAGYLIDQDEEAAVTRESEDDIATWKARHR